MLLEDYALALRLVTQGPVPADANSTVQLEIVDERTGKRVTDAPTLTGLTIDGKIESSIVTLTNSGPGLFTVDHKFGEPGQVPLTARLHGDSIDRTFNLSIEVTKNPPPHLESQTPGGSQTGAPSPLRVRWVGNATPPDRLIAVIDGRRIELNDRNTDNVYSGTWTPDSPGAKKIRFEAESGVPPPLEIEVEVTAPPPPALPGPGDLDFGPSATPVDPGPCDGRRRRGDRASSGERPRGARDGH